MNSSVESAWYLVEHAPTVYDAGPPGSDRKERHLAWLDMPVEKGREGIADESASFFKGKSVDAIFTSDLQRARFTADRIGKVVGLKPIVTKEARPWDKGILVGQEVDETKKDVEHYVENPTEEIPGGESVEKYENRWGRHIRMALDHLRRNPGRSLITATHSVNINSLPKMLFGAHEGSFSHTRPAPGSVHAVTLHAGQLKIHKVFVPEEF